jgi:uncharacterized protein (TIGR02646 family)
VRPVERGQDTRADPWPSWGAAADDLAARMGWYCAYCEVSLRSAPHVEHKQPKEHHPHLALTWSNFVLACTNCNSTKGTKNVGLNASLWPDRDNTARAFAYGDGGVVSVRHDLDPPAIPLANALRDLVGLDRRPGHVALTPTDRRWMRRLEAYNKAVVTRGLIEDAPDDTPRRDLTVMIATETGFFSVWMAVFSADTDMRRRLIDAFLVAGGCYDEAGVETPRPGGAC